MPRPGKAKSTAVLLAVFLTFWTRLYTYKVDAAKFWIGLVANSFGLLLVLIPVLDIVTSFVGVFIWLAVWAWAIVDTAARPQSFYDSVGR